MKYFRAEGHKVNNFLEICHELKKFNSEEEANNFVLRKYKQKECVLKTGNYSLRMCTDGSKS